jgi:O-antigen ligase
MAGLAQQLSWGKTTRERLMQAADGLVLALVISLPWSTSATGILAVLWLVALLPTLTLESLRRELMTPAGGLPVLLWALAVLGLLWSTDATLYERFRGFGSYHKLLAIPLLMAQFRRSDRGIWIAIGYLASCSILLLWSWGLLLMPDLLPRETFGRRLGVPVKDYIAQGGAFVLCGFLIAAIAVHAWNARPRWITTALAFLALAFLINIFFTATSRTAVVMIGVLFMLFIAKQARWGLRIGLVSTVLVLGALVSQFSLPAATNINDLINEVRAYTPEGERTRAGERLVFWSKSLEFIKDAPLIGHGTGSIAAQFRRTVDGKTGMAAEASTNPHNQTLAVAIQLGLVGTMVLLAMWIAHLLLFIRGHDLVAWAGLVVVTQNIVGSLFNSHLFDFTQGWGYVMGVGVAAGTVLKRAQHDPSDRSDAGLSSRRAASTSQ